MDKSKILPPYSFMQRKQEPVKQIPTKAKLILDIDLPHNQVQLQNPNMLPSLLICSILCSALSGALQLENQARSMLVGQNQQPLNSESSNVKENHDDNAGGRGTDGGESDGGDGGN